MLYVTYYGQTVIAITMQLSLTQRRPRVIDVAIKVSTTFASILQFSLDYIFIFFLLQLQLFCP